MIHYTKSLVCCQHEQAENNFTHIYIYEDKFEWMENTRMYLYIP